MLYQAGFVQDSGHEPYILLLTIMFTNYCWAWLSFMFMGMQGDRYQTL